MKQQDGTLPGAQALVSDCDGYRTEVNKNKEK